MDGMSGDPAGRSHASRELDRTRPGAAASLCEGMAQTLSVLRVGVPPTLACTMVSIACT
jgi:putative transposase